MFWRPNHKTGASGGSANWPRDGAVFKGIVHEVNGKKWLECKLVKQKNDSEFKRCPKESWMPFRHSQYFLEKA